MRFLVVQPPFRDGDDGPLSARPLGVGALRWRAPDPCLTIVAKAAFSYATGRLAPASRHPLPCAEVTCDAPGREAELRYPSDFVPFKPVVDVLLTGHAFAAGGPALRIDARVALGSVARRFALLASKPAAAIPLGARHVHDLDGTTPAVPVGPLPQGAVPPPGAAHPEAFDYAAYCSAALPQRSEPFGRGARLELAGLSPRGSLVLGLPELAPRVLVRWTGVGDEEVAMNCDTVWVDTDDETVVLVWRGSVDHPRDLCVDELVVALERLDDDWSWDAITRNALRGTFAFAVEPDHPDPAPEPGTDEVERLQAARYQAHGAMLGAEPARSLEDYALVSAELAEQREPRADTLRRHGLDEDGWLVEERGWLEAMADHALRGDGTLAARYGELFVAAQDRLGAPGEDARTVAEYANLAAALEVADDLAKALERHELTLASWMRLERRFLRAFEADPALESEFQRELAAARGRHGGEPGGEPRDEDGGS
ncbi:MAG: DUF2169 domain-containing protein [Myxococcales bacterium]|nr:DUF2169 domain-containing protein [Myxococcales bacterium]